MVAPLIALHGILVAGAIVVRKANDAIDAIENSISRRDPIYALHEAIDLDVLAPINVVSNFITDYEHLHHDEWHGLKNWLSNCNPPKKIQVTSHSSSRAIKDGEDVKKLLRRHTSCVAAETFRISSVDAIMDSIAPKRTKGGGIARRKRAGLEHKVSTPYNVCMEWTATAHPNKPEKWTRVSLAVSVSRIQAFDTTEVRLAMLQSQVKPMEIPRLVLDSIMRQRVGTATIITATVMKWIRDQSESTIRIEKEKKLLKHDGTIEQDLLQKTKRAIKSDKAQKVLEELDRRLLAEKNADTTVTSRIGKVSVANVDAGDDASDGVPDSSETAASKGSNSTEIPFESRNGIVGIDATVTYSTLEQPYDNSVGKESLHGSEHDTSLDTGEEPTHTPAPQKSVNSVDKKNAGGIDLHRGAQLEDDKLKDSSEARQAIDELRVDVTSSTDRVSKKEGGKRQQVGVSDEESPAAEDVTSQAESAEEFNEDLSPHPAVPDDTSSKQESQLQEVAKISMPLVQSSDRIDLTQPAELSQKQYFLIALMVALCFFNICLCMSR